MTRLTYFWVDNAYSCDPRIKKFKEEGKAKKEAEKRAKAEARRKEQEAKEKVRPSESGQCCGGFRRVWDASGFRPRWWND